MKAKALFSQVIQPKIIQYMIDHYGKSYDTVDTVKNSWRLTYPVSDEIIEDVFIQIKTIEKFYLPEQFYHSDIYQTLLSETIADHLLRYVRRSETHKKTSRAETKAFIIQNIDLSVNKIPTQTAIIAAQNFIPPPSLDENKIVCHCAGISIKEIRLSVENGSRSVADVRNFLNKHTIGNCVETSPYGVCCHKKIKKLIKKFCSKLPQSTELIKELPEV